MGGVLGAINLSGGSLRLAPGLLEEAVKSRDA